MSNITEPPWLAEAESLLGLKEIVGSKHEAKILEFFREAGHPEVHDDETAWCAAFAGAMLHRAGIAGTGALNARSYLDWGVQLASPTPGAISVFKRGDSAWQGHIAFFLRDLGAQIEVLGGNQSNSVTIAREPKASLLGYRWPAGVKIGSAASYATASAPEFASKPLLQIGSRGEAVLRLQSELNAFGARPRLALDGEFGPRTRVAVASFQRTHWLVSDGLVGPKTWAMLDGAAPKRSS